MHMFVTLISGPWRIGESAIIGLLGLVMLWQGLAGEHGLLRRRIPLLARIEGWRQSLLGLALIGLGAAWMWESRLLLFLTLGIAFTEMREASIIIAAMKRDRRHGPAQPT